MLFIFFKATSVRFQLARYTTPLFHFFQTLAQSWVRSDETYKPPLPMISPSSTSNGVMVHGLRSTCWPVLVDRYRRLWLKKANSSCFPLFSSIRLLKVAIKAIGLLFSTSVCHILNWVDSHEDGDELRASAKSRWSVTSCSSRKRRDCWSSLRATSFCSCQSEISTRADIYRTIN